MLWFYNLITVVETVIFVEKWTKPKNYEKRMQIPEKTAEYEKKHRLKL